jgi:hypothetical protein
VINGACSTDWGIKNTYTILVCEPERNRPLWTLRRRWENNIKIDVTGYGLMAGFYEQGNEPWVSINDGEFLD